MSELDKDNPAPEPSIQIDRKISEILSDSVYRATALQILNIVLTCIGLRPTAHDEGEHDPNCQNCKYGEGHKHQQDNDGPRQLSHHLLVTRTASVFVVLTFNITTLITFQF